MHGVHDESVQCHHNGLHVDPDIGRLHVGTVQYSKLILVRQRKRDKGRDRDRDRETDGRTDRQTEKEVSVLLTLSWHSSNCAIYLSFS